VLEWYRNWSDAVAGHARYVNQFTRIGQRSDSPRSAPHNAFTPRVPAFEETAFRENDMKRLLSPDQLNEYRTLTKSKQSQVAQLISKGYDYGNAKRLASDYLDDTQ
jgi:hypothetical protein